MLNLLLPENPLVIFIKKKKSVSSLVAGKKTHHCLLFFPIVSPLGYPTNWLLGLEELLHALLLQ